MPVRVAAEPATRWFSCPCGINTERNTDARRVFPLALGFCLATTATPHVTFGTRDARPLRRGSPRRLLVERGSDSAVRRGHDHDAQRVRRIWWFYAQGEHADFATARPHRASG